MKRLILVLVVFFFSFSNVSAMTIDFNSLQAWNYSESEFNSFFSGVTFSSTGGGDFIVRPTTLGAPFSGNTVRNSISTIARFDLATDFMSITMGDYNDDPDDLYLFAYDLKDNLVASDFYANPSTSYSGYNLSVSLTAPKISWVEYYALGDNGNSIHWDNFAFNDTPSTVPIPSSIFLLSVGCTMIIGLRQYIKSYLNKPT